MNISESNEDGIGNSRKTSRRGDGKVIIAHFVGQSALILALPIVTRHFDPLQLGLYQTALALSLVLTPIATLRSEFVMPSLRTEGEYQRVRKIVFVILGAVVASLLTSAVIALASGSTRASSVLAMCSLLVVAYSWTALDNAHVIRRGNSKQLATRNLLSGLVSALLQVTVCLFWPTPVGLALAILIGRGIAISVAKATRTNTRESKTLDLSRTGEWKFSRGLNAVISGTAASGADQSLLVFSGMAWGPGPAAQVGVARQVSSGPMGVLSQGLSQITQLKVAPLMRQRDPRVIATIKQQVRLLSPIALVALCALIVLGPLLAGPILGEEWDEAGKIIAILAPPSSLQILFAPLMPTFAMMGRESVLARMQIFRLILCIVTLVGSIQIFDSYLPVVFCFSLANTLWYLLVYRILLRNARVYVS